MYKVIVAGSSSFYNYELLKQKMDHYLKNNKEIMIISSGSKGADELGIGYAHEKVLIIK